MKAICNYFLTKVTGLSLSLLFGIAANAQCPNNNERIYATSDNWHSLGGFLSNGINSFDQNPSTAAEITTVVGALGLGGGYYDLFFDQTLTAGTPVTIKVGKQYSGLSTVSSFLVYGLNSSGNPIGVGEPVNPGLLSLLSADSAFEFTFIPQNGSGNQPFSGVRVYLGSLLSVADTFKIYEVYVKQQSATANCTSFQFDDYDDDNDGIDDLLDGIQPTDPYVRKDVMDLHYGVQVLAGLNALSATASVVHPWQAVDSDVVNYAILNRGVAVLNSAQIKVDFKAQSIIGDQIEILLSRPDNNILQLGLINGFQINLYNNGVHVMGPITNLDPMLNLELLNLVNTTDEVASLTLTPPMVFDQVTISYGGVANVLDAIKVHEVSKKPVIETVLVPNGTGEIDMCSTNQLSFQIQDNCTNYIVYDSAMNPLNTSNNYDFDLPIGITEGDYIFYVQAVRQGCEIGLLQEVAVHINQNAVDTDIADVLLNGNITPVDVCLANNPQVILTTQLSGISTITNPTFHWYDENGNPITGGSNGTLDLGTLSPGTYTYGVAVEGDQVCLNLTPKTITFTIQDENTPTTSNSTQQFCTGNNPTVADLQTNESPIVWYDALTGGNVVTSSTALVDGEIYYAAYQGATCESSSRLAITVTLTDEPTPTTTNTTQQFCAGNNPRVADLQTNESPIVWYDALTGGNVVTSTTALVDGAIYYAAYQGTTCESSSRLAITVTLLNNAIANLNGPSGNACYRASDANSVYTTDASMTNYQWVVTGGIIINGGGTNDDFVEVNWNTLPSGNVSVSYDSASICGGSASQSFDVQIVPCSNLNITKTADHDEVAVGDTVVFTITVYNSGTSNVTDVNVSENLPSGYTYVSHTTSTGTYDVNTGIWNIPTLDANTSETLMVTVTVNADGDYVNMAEIIGDPVDTDPDDNVVLAEVSVVCLTVYNEFSPNNDGENDYFIIDCIENYPNNKIEIFNRYGNVVYQTSSYDNSWTGVANVSGVVGKGEYLPNGTYYYVLKIEELNYSKTGWLYLAR